MPITITIPAPLRQFAGGQSQITVEAKTAGEALDLLTSTHSGLRRHLFNDQNVLRNFVNVYLNDEDIRHASGPSTPVKDGDTIMIVPSIAGGAVIESEVAQSLPELSNEEILRYSRHLIMPEVGMQGQRRLKAASVLMIGTGGLGASALSISTSSRSRTCSDRSFTAPRISAGARSNPRGTVYAISTHTSRSR